jgi:site-specific DNA-methyltransferase (cytosine-N4-specific)
LARKWISFEEEPAYLAASAFRFIGKSQNPIEALSLYKSLICQQEPIDLSCPQQLAMKL